MKKSLLFIILAIALYGCPAGPRTTPTWVKHGASPQDLKRDKSSCDWSARIALPDSPKRPNSQSMYDNTSGIVAEQEHQKRYDAVFDQCMKVRGWQKKE